MKGYTFGIGFVIAILACLLLLPGAWAQQPKQGGTLRVAWEADVPGLDPHLSPGIQAYRIVGNLFNSLVTIDTELNYVPDLAESWEVLEDGKVYVFHLRRGVKFHDGTDFDAEVVRWNYQRIMDPEEKGFDAPYYSPEKARALLKEAGYDEKNPLRYTLMTHSGEASLPTVATIIKTQLAKIGVEAMVEVIDRPIFLRRYTRDRDWEQSVNLAGAALDPYTISRAIDSRAGNNTINHQDTQVDALIDRMKEAATEEAFRQAGYDFQRYIAENMMATSVASVPFLQATRTYAKGYEHLHGFKILFETTWLEK